MSPFCKHRACILSICLCVSFLSADTADTAKDSRQEAEKPDKNNAALPANASFASIQNGGLTVADGNRWYYESFDTQGRVVFTVLYEKDREIEKITRQYASLDATHPSEQITVTASGTEKMRYTADGKTLSVEVYGKNKELIEKTENRYNKNGKLVEQIHTRDGNTEKSVWDFVRGKAVSQTKYRNDEKTAFIELHSGKRIVHIYKNDVEVFVTEER